MRKRSGSSSVSSPFGGRPFGSPNDEGTLAREIAGEPEERAYLLSLGFDPAVVETMLAADRAGKSLDRTPPKGTAAELRRKLAASYRPG